MLIRDNYQNFKSYRVPKAQLIVADIPYCYDTETECWTTKGWKKYSELSLDDTVMSLNPIKLEIEYSGIEKIIIKENDERMIRFDSSDLDLLVTENHRMFTWYSYNTKTFNGAKVRKHKTGDGIRLAKQVNSLCYIPRSGYAFKSTASIDEMVIPSCEINTNGDEHTAEEMPIPIDIWLSFFGLWLADGCTCSSKAKNGRQLYTVSIKQAGENRIRVSNLMDSFPIKYTEYKNKGTNKSNFNIHSKQLWLYLEQFGKSKDKFIPRWILDLPVEKLRIFWDWYTFGDSSKNGKGLHISSISKSLIEGLQEIALKLGCICQIRTVNHETWKNPLYYFQYNHNSKNIVYGSKKTVSGYNGVVWCLTLKTNSVFLVRRNGKIAFSGNCIGQNAYGSNPSWYVGGDNKNGESELAGKSFFDTDENFKPAEFMHFASQMLRKEPKNRNEAPCMIIFCAFDQQMYLIELGKRYGFNNYINLVFRKNFSAQVLKANMRVVGNAEYGLILYRDKLPKFRNNGKMVFNIIDWEKDSNEKLHPTQKPIPLLEKLIKIFTDEGDVVIDPVAGSGSTLVAAENLNRKAYGFEINKEFYTKATKWIERNRIVQREIKELGYAKSEIEKINPVLF